MTSTAMDWFYNTPQTGAYQLAEQVRSTFWEQRLGNLWLDTVRAESPFCLLGWHHAARIQIQWEPGHWLRLASSPASPLLVSAITNILRHRPALRYEDLEGFTVWEWQLSDPEKRWQEIQGKLAFRHPSRMQTPPRSQTK